jgi:hypothetical protein
MISSYFGNILTSTSIPLSDGKRIDKRSRKIFLAFSLGNVGPIA